GVVPAAAPAGLGFTLVAAGLAAAGTSSSAFAFFDRDAGFLTMPSPAAAAASPVSSTLGFGTRLGLGASGRSRPLPSFTRSAFASVLSRGLIARIPLWPISSAATMRSLLVTPSSLASSITFILAAATVPSPPYDLTVITSTSSIALAPASHSTAPSGLVSATAGCARASRSPAARTAAARLGLASLGFLKAWPSRPRLSPRSRHGVSGQTYAPRPAPDSGQPGVDTRQHLERGALLDGHRLARGALGLDFRLALDVDAHARELRREARVLALLADGERELVVGHDDRRRGLPLAVGLVDRHRRDLRRRERARHERRRVVRPLDDVDLLAAQLAADDLDARAAQADARADRIDVALGRRDRDLRPLARLARGGLDQDDPFLDLGDLGLEEPREVARMRTRERDLRPLGRPAHLEHVGANPIARVVALAQNLLPLGQDRLGLADLENHVALLDSMDDAAEDLALLAHELRVDPLALGVAHLLEDDFLGRLRRDPPEVLGRPLLLELELVVELGVGVQRLGVVEADLLFVVGDLGHDLLAAIDPEVAAVPVDVH